MLLYKLCFIYQNAYSQTGGIQTFNKYFISALEDIKNETDDITIKLVGIYDDQKDVKTSLPFMSMQNSKAKALQYIIKHCNEFDTFIFAHVNLAPLAAIVRLLNKKAKIVFCTHGIEIWKKLPAITEWVMNRSTVLTVSNYSKSELLKYNPKLKDVRIFPNCIKVKPFESSLQNPYDSQNFNILTVTRLSKTERLKGVDSVIKTLPLLKEKIPHLRYSVIGKGEDVKRLKKLAEELNVSHLVDFLGFVESIDAYYQYCDVFTLPSKKEGFGIVYLEAMQYKKPVVAVNFGGPTDVVMDGETGFLCPYDDIHCLANKFFRLFDNDILSKKLGNKGYERLNNNFTYEKYKKRLKAVLWSLTEK